MKEASPVIAYETSDCPEMHLRKVSIPPNKYKPLKKAWKTIYDLVYNVMKTDIRMNPKAGRVELKARQDINIPTEINQPNIQNCADFVNAFVAGFDVEDAKKLLPMDYKEQDVFMGSYVINSVSDVLPVGLYGEDLEAISVIEKATNTSILIAGSIIHILGDSHGIRVAISQLRNLISESKAMSKL